MFTAIYSLGRLLIAVVAGLLMASGGAAPAANTEKAGTLTCTATGSGPYVPRATKDLDCTFQPLGDGNMRIGFTGTLRRYGFDVGLTEKLVVVWDVLVSSRPVSRRTVAGTYRGKVESDAAPPILVGGYMDRVTLVPVTMPKGEPANGSASIAELELVARPLKA